MDIYRTRKRTTNTQRSVDGFFVQSPNSVRQSSNVVGKKGLSGQSSTRRVGDFRGTDGFYNAPRRQPGVGAASAAARPGRPRHGDAASSRVIADQFAAASPVASGKPGKKLRGRKAKAAAQAAGLTKRQQKKLLKQQKKATRSRAKSIFIWSSRALGVTLVLVLAVGGVLFAKGYLQLKKVFDGTSTAAGLTAEVDPTLLKGEGDGRVNVLMMGIGGAEHDGGDLTDTLMIVSVDPVNNQAILFSVPRDLWVKMPNNYIANYQKINAAYESGKYKYLGSTDQSNENRKAIEAGFAAADSTVERVMGVPIHYNALVNFRAFRQAVDTVGGVTIDAPEQLYDPTMAWENGWSPILAKKGTNTFDGKHALNYVRSRETSSDFARSQRQRAVMLALKDKVLDLGTLSNPVKMSNLLNAFGDNVQTDISLTDMQRMVAIMKKIPTSSVQSVGLTDDGNNYITTGNVNGLSVVQPRAGLEDYSEIQAFVRSKLKDGYIAQENAKVSILNGTFTPGLATDKADELKSYGYNVITVDNAPTDDYGTTKIIDLSGGKKKYTINYLKKRFNVNSVSNKLPESIVQGTAEIVIILGQDAAVTTQN